MTDTSFNQWQFWIDRGGTFTDIVAKTPTGEIIVHKLLSENPERYQDAPVQGIRNILGIDADTPISAEQIEVVKMGTTVATNALLERKGERTVLVITKGFKDALRIGYQNRPDIFARQIVLPEMLYGQVIEVEERYSARGEELIAVNRERVRQDLQAAYDAGICSCAIILMHGYRYPQHEREIASIAWNIGFSQVSVSHKVNPLMKLISRGDTTVVDAYLSPILDRYVERVSGQLNGGNKNSPNPVRLMFMQSNGGLADASLFHGKDSILSGPAGGVVGAVKTCQMAGFNKIIGFDMGGTSTDVSHYAGEYERSFETEVAGVRLRAPMMSIHTVAAGGGSILQFDGARYRVGPESAGANPGPAAYGRGGPLTVTDANVMVGKLQPEFFPKVFGTNADLPLNKEIVTEKFRYLAREIGNERTPEQVAAGFLAIAVQNMANAIKKISLQRGYDVSEYTLCCFGAAGGQHACLIADVLGIKQIFIHPYAGVLSAYGIGLADIRILREKAIEAYLTKELIPQLEQQLQELIVQCEAELEEQQTKDRGEIAILRKVHLKYEGTDASLIVNFDDVTKMRQQFEQIHQQRYGFVAENKQLIVEEVSAELICPTNNSQEPIIKRTTHNPPQSVATVKMYAADSWRDTPVFKREDLQPGDIISSPAVIIEATGTNVIELGWQAEVTNKNHLILNKIKTSVGDGAHKLGRVVGFRRTEAKFRPSRTTTKTASPIGQSPLQNPKVLNQQSPDPVMLEIFNNLFRSIAEQMGTTLQNTSYSVNIKERLDFSCAIFDREGHLVANAPHIPVHLGSMSESVRSLIAAKGNTLQPGDVYMQNNPYNGGTHLPDVTVITPVFSPYQRKEGTRGQGDKETTRNAISPSPSLPLSQSPPLPVSPSPHPPIFYVASRGHHADIGGITPGSMPPASKTIEEEGILIDNFQLVEGGHFRERELRELLKSAKYPVRNEVQNIADLQAQIAANEKGVQELHRIVEHYGLETVQAYMGFVQDNAEEAVRRVIDVLKDSNFSLELDNGGKIQVAITINREKRSANIDFTGTSSQLDNNFNAPVAVTKAAVLYVFRTLVDDNIPLNYGCLKPLEIVIPEGCMLNPRYPAAVVAGNVETSQNITDCLYGALGVMAASQGTMNNFTFGNDKYQYYETICGGSGAGENFNGTDAVHTHMTNSRLTDPEVLEWRFPVLLESFSIRSHSGGKGKYSGGNGVIRKVRFLEPMTAGILSSRRIIPSFGLNGGEAGAVGKNYVQRQNGTVKKLDSTAVVEMQPGDTFVIETPGGGGYGAED